ncbi:MAG: deoxynucleoside kinase [Terriglobia bacterium]
MTGAPQYEQPRLIAIEGPLRVGKTSLADLLAERLHAERLRDVEENPFLESFYKGRPGSAFASQLFFLMERYKQWLSLDLQATADRVVVSDYLFSKDRIYAYLNLEDEELNLYDRYYSIFSDQVPIPDLVIYLQAKPEKLRERIARKNVPAEHQISGEYLDELVRAYEHFFARYKESNLLVVETSGIDFVHRNRDLEELVYRLRQPVKGTQYFLPLGSAKAD